MPTQKKRTFVSILLFITSITLIYQPESSYAGAEGRLFPSAQSSPTRQAKRPKKRSALLAELRGLSQIVLHMRKNMRKMKRQMQSMRKRHRKAIQKLYNKLNRRNQPNKRHTRTNPPDSARPTKTKKAIVQLKRQMKAIQLRLTALHAQVQQQKLSSTGSHTASRTSPKKHPAQPGSKYKNPYPTRKKARRNRTKGPTIGGREYSKGFYMLTFIFPFLVRSIDYKLSNMSGFRSTGFTNIHNPLTGTNYPKYYIMTRHLHAGTNWVWFRYRNAKGQMFGPFKRRVKIKTKGQSDADNFVRYQWSNPMMHQLRHRTYRRWTYFFFFWASSKRIIKIARYSLGSPSLHNKLIQNGRTVGSSSIHKRRLNPGKYTLYARFELINGFISPLLEYHIKVTPDGRWNNTHPVLPSK